MDLQSEQALQAYSVTSYLDGTLQVAAFKTRLEFQGGDPEREREDGERRERGLTWQTVVCPCGQW
mgnify:CR=1 FL=1